MTMDSERRGSVYDANDRSRYRESGKTPIQTNSTCEINISHPFWALERYRSIHTPVYYACISISYATTTHTRTKLSEKPPKRVCPSTDHAREVHSGLRAFSPTSLKSGCKLSTIDLIRRVNNQIG